MGYEYSEERNEELINKYHQIYVDIFGDNAEQVERFIAYSMTGVVKYRTNLLFNLGKTAANGKSTITNMYKAVLPLYWTQINKNIFTTKNKANQKEVSKFRNKRHVFCDEIDIYNLDTNQFKLTCEDTMTVRLLYEEVKIFVNHSHLYITTNTEPRLKPDEGLLRRGLLVETDNKFVNKKSMIYYLILINRILVLKLLILILLIILNNMIIN